MDPLVIGIGALVALYLLGGSKKTTTSPTKPASTIPPFPYTQIGRASCRERV